MATNEKNTQTLQQKPVSIKRTFDLPIETMWKAWSEPGSYKKWWGPSNFTCPHASIDFKVGGKYLSCMKAQDGKEFWSTGTYREIVPQQKIVLTDSFSDSEGNHVQPSEMGMPGEWPEELLVTVTFEESGDQTILSLTHQGIPDEMYEECTQGWNESLDKLEKNLK